MSVATKRDPQLWEDSKQRACSKAGLCLHSARKMQWATRDYKARGGKYSGKKSRDNRLATWTKQRWRTHSGKPSKGRLRYLPNAAWSVLSKDQIRRTNATKRAGHARGRQYVRQPSDVRDATRRHRQ